MSLTNAQKLLLLLSGGLSVAQQLENYITNTLAPILWYDGTLTADATPKMKNKGSAGAALDGTITAVTVDANGMNFNGTTSKIVVPDNAAIQALATYSIITVCQATGAGENNAGTVLHLGAGGSRFGISGATGSWRMGFDTGTTDADSTTDAGFFVNGVWTAMFGSYDDVGDRKCHIQKGIGGAVVTPTGSESAATGTRVAPIGAIVGNFSDVRTWNGFITAVLVCNRVVTTAERLQYTQLAGV